MAGTVGAVTHRGSVCAAALVIAALGGCATPPGPIPEGERAAITRELEQVQDAFQAAITGLDVEAYLGFLAPPVELRFARDGELVRGLHDRAKEQFTAVDSMTCDWPDRTVTVLSRDAATVTVTYRCEGRNTDGTTWSSRGAWTNVLQRRLDRWVIVEVHESHPPATAQ